MATSSYCSYFPIVASFGLIGMAAGGGGMMNHMSSGGVGYAFPHLVFLVGTLLLAFVLFNWFSKVVVKVGRVCTALKWTSRSAGA